MKATRLACIDIFVPAGQLAHNRYKNRRGSEKGKLLYTVCPFPKTLIKGFAKIPFHSA
jgi:hypothetical protein